MKPKAVSREACGYTLFAKGIKVRVEEAAVEFWWEGPYGPIYYRHDIPGDGTTLLGEEARPCDLPEEG